MRALIFLLLFLPEATETFAQVADETPKDARDRAPNVLRTITAKLLARHANHLAADDMEGRLTGTPGQVRATEYVQKAFADAGLEPLGDLVGEKRQWNQAYPIHRLEILPESGLFDTAGGRAHRFGAWAFHQVEPLRVEGVLVNAGNATAHDLRRLSEHPAEGAQTAGGDLASVIPVVTLHLEKTGPEEPDTARAAIDGRTIINDLKLRANRLRQLGARCMVVLVPRFNAAFLQTSNAFWAYPGKPSFSLADPHAKKDAVWLRSMMGTRIPVLILEWKDARPIVDALGLSSPPGESTSAAEAVGGASRNAFTLIFSPKAEDTTAVNVVGCLRGRDQQLSREALVYSAHMDHVGLAADGRAFNGADDDASGTAALLEIASAYARLPKDARPRRTLIFLSVSGEELGLWGSAHFAQHSPWALDDVVANINMDMIGRSTRRVPEHAIAITPTHLRPEYSTLAREAALLGSAWGLSMRDGDRFYERSDHFNFAKRGIPVVFFTDDEHEDYHRVTDDPEKLDFLKMERVAQLAFLLGYRTAEREQVPQKLGRCQDWFGEPSRPR